MTAGAAPSMARDGGSLRAMSQVGLRIASGLVLAAIALLATWSGLWPFVLLVAVSVVVAAWEWSRLVRGGEAGPVMLCQAGAGIAACLVTALGRPVAALGVLALGALAGAVLARDGREGRWSALGVLYLGAPVIALVALRADPAYGWYAVLYLFTVVWSIDTAAYAIGTLIGGPKLAPRISPGKTWSGFAGGLLAAALAGYAWASWLGQGAALLLTGFSAGLAVVAQIGDLAESAVKRAFHHKDASHLIPGHGGLLDRVDSLIFAAVAAGLVAALRGADAPGQAILIWP